ncbi:MAG: hypothetical protein MN733_36015, partial [Nitrososphaera sp.]|nr:hypothetical protein [Nitrososphaera sp.]
LSQVRPMACGGRSVPPQRLGVRRRSLEPSRYALRGYMDEAKKLIDEHGSPGLDIWHDRLLARGFRPIPSTITVYDGKTWMLDCLPNHPSKQG